MKRLLIWLFGFVLMAGADDRKLAPELKRPGTSAPFRVIVQYRSNPTERHRHGIWSRGGSVEDQLDSINSLVAMVPANKIADLAGDPEVKYVSPDRPLKGMLNNAAPAILANYAWQRGLDGTGVSVAVIDSGVHLVDDLKDAIGKGSRIKYQFDTIGGGNDDKYGHGTHVAGIIAGNGRYSNCSSCDVSIRGIAPNLNIVNIHALDQNGQGTDTSVINAIQKVISLKTTYNIRVINLSLGRPVMESYETDPLCQAVEQAWKAGIVVVVAAGNNGRDNSTVNNGYATITSPGNDPYVMTVGAMRSLGTPRSR